jgi:hypothetical protein
MNTHNSKLTMLANEFNATIEHAKEIVEEYIEAAIKQAIVDKFNEIVNIEDMIMQLSASESNLNQNDVINDNQEEVIWNILDEEDKPEITHKQNVHNVYRKQSIMNLIRALNEQ